ncbi:hypothetical protein [Streptomyces afghaniensis 772] [Streptomyces afghaniensis]
MCHDLPPLHLWRRLLLRLLPGHPDLRQARRRAGHPADRPIRVPAQYDTPGGNLPALPSALPALPAAPSQPAYGYPQAQQPAPLQQAPAAYIPQQATAPRGYPGPQPQQPRPAAPAGYEAMRPAAPRPAQLLYQDPYNNQQYRGY